MNNASLLIDGIIIVLYFVGIIALGLYMGRREKSLKDYALGGRQVPWWAVMASIIAAETSAATYLTVPGEGYKAAAVTYTQLAFGIILGRLFVGYVFLKPYYEYKVYTVYDFLAIRFGNRSKNFASALFLVMRTLAMGVRVFVPSLIMVLAWRLFIRGEEVRDLAAGDSWVPYMGAIIVLVVVTGIYTTLGGIKAVIWTDVVQAALMFSTALIAVGTLFYQLGSGSPARSLQMLAEKAPDMRELKGYIVLGWEGAPAGASVGQKLLMMIANPYTIIAAVLGGILGNMAVFGTDQDMVQRMLTATDYRKSRRSLITSALMDVPIFFVFAFIGVLLLALYSLPQYAGFAPNKPNDVFGVYILKIMPPVIRGLILAGLFATAMGSLSAALNALATSATNDWYLPYFGRKHGEHRLIDAARVFTVLFAVLMVVIATLVAYDNVKNPEHSLIPIALGVPALFIGPMGGVFLLGMVTKRRGSDRGNVVAIIAGLVGVFYLSGTYLKILLPFAGESAFGRLLRVSQTPGHRVHLVRGHRRYDHLPGRPDVPHARVGRDQRGAPQDAGPVK